MKDKKKTSTNILDSCSADISFAQKILESNGLLMTANKLCDENGVISPPFEGKRWDHTDSLENFYTTNKSGCLFYLKDCSFFTFYAVALGNEIIRFSFGYCSCALYDEGFLFENSATDLSDDGENEGLEEKEMSPNHDEIQMSQAQKKIPVNLLTSYAKKVFPGKVDLIKTILTLAENPVYIRCDFDASKTAKIHPRNHLTLNFMEESRFFIDGDFTYKDFVIFILDLVYGIKPEEPFQKLIISGSNTYCKPKLAKSVRK